MNLTFFWLNLNEFELIGLEVGLGLSLLLLCLPFVNHTLQIPAAIPVVYNADWFVRKMSIGLSVLGLTVELKLCVCLFLIPLPGRLLAW